MICTSSRSANTSSTWRIHSSHSGPTSSWIRPSAKDSWGWREGSITSTLALLLRAFGGTHELLVALEGAQQSFTVFRRNVRADLLKLLPSVLRVTHRFAELRRHIHRVHLAFGLVAEIQVRPVPARRIVCACARGVSALAGRLRQRSLHHRGGDLFEFVQAFTLTTHYVVRYQAADLTSSLRVSRGPCTPSNQVRSCRKCVAAPVGPPREGASFLRRKVARAVWPF